MQIEIGKVYEGTVKNITKYGAFVEIDNPDGERLMGMVHISEISRNYVNEINDFVTEGQQVRVKAIGINPQGKISLSMKQLEEPVPAGEKRKPRERNFRNNAEGQPRSGGNRGRKPNVWKPKEKPAPTELSFEDMLSRFKQNSEERIGDIKRNTERKNRSRRK